MHSVIREVYALTLDDGRSLLFDVHALRLAVEQRRAYVVNTPPAAYGIEEARLKSARENREWKPIIIAMIGGKAYVVDGQHRVAVALDEGHPEMVAHVFGDLEWPQFVLPVAEDDVASVAKLGDKYVPRR